MNLKMDFLVTRKVRTRINSRKKYAKLISELIMIFAVFSPLANCRVTPTGFGEKYNLFVQKQYYKLKNFNYYNFIRIAS